jgi:hypothetical protein
MLTNADIQNIILRLKSGEKLTVNDGAGLYYAHTYFFENHTFTYDYNDMRDFEHRVTTFKSEHDFIQHLTQINSETFIAAFRELANKH